MGILIEFVTRVGRLKGQHHSIGDKRVEPFWMGDGSEFSPKSEINCDIFNFGKVSHYNKLLFLVIISV